MGPAKAQNGSDVADRLVRLKRKTAPTSLTDLKSMVFEQQQARELKRALRPFGPTEIHVCRCRHTADTRPRSHRSWPRHPNLESAPSGNPIRPSRAVATPARPGWHARWKC